MQTFGLDFGFCHHSVAILYVGQLYFGFRIWDFAFRILNFAPFSSNSLGRKFGFRILNVGARTNLGIFLRRFWMLIFCIRLPGSAD